MISTRRLVLAALCCAVLTATPSFAVTLPFTEDFLTTANWADAALNPFGLSFVDMGGPDGSSYVSQAFSFGPLPDGESAALFRAQDEFNSSDGAFEGDWIAEGVGVFSAFVRHNLPVPVNFFTRFSGPMNFPGGIAVEFVPVFPNTWTEISFEISETNPQFVSFEGMEFSDVFANVGHVQIGANVPDGFGGNPAFWQFDVDKATVVPVPEPTCTLSVLLGFGCLVLRRRK